VTRERDRRFALLVAMMIPAVHRRLPCLKPANASTQARERTMSDDSPVVTEHNEDRIRQGLTGHNVRYVVIVSLALAITAFIIIAAVARP
jgi:hypothetical protein